MAMGWVRDGRRMDAALPPVARKPLRRSQGVSANLIAALVLPVTVALLYEAAVRVGLAEGRLLPPPSRIAEELWFLVRSGDLLTHIEATLGRVLAGFALGSIIGIALGGLTGASHSAHRFLDPTIQGLRAIPSLAWVPLFVLWLGIFEPSKIALIATGVFFPVYLGTSSAMQRVEQGLVELAHIYRAQQSQVARLIYVPALLPEIVTALRSGLGLGFMFVVAAEIMGASEGLGYLLVDGQQLGKADQILAAIVVFALLGKILDGLLVGLSHPFVRWRLREDRPGPGRLVASRSAAAPSL